MGSKGIPAKYGGFETFVDELVSRKKNEKISYVVTCLNSDKQQIHYKEARLIHVSIPETGSAKALIYDIVSLSKIIQDIKRNNIKNAVVYILACRIGPLMGFYRRKLKQLGVDVFLNPDGHEWKRSKWNYFIRRYWKISEKLMVKNADVVICDSKNIEKYIKETYSIYNPETTFISYGADISKSKFEDDNDVFLKWLIRNNTQSNEYYLIVGRFVPENNYELIIKEFMKSKTSKKLIIISNVEKNAFYHKLVKETNFVKDERIKFVGTVYDSELLKKIREKAYAYLHGHSVGGTNPSLLEALASSKLSILYDVGFNREVAENSTLYFSKDKNRLADQIAFADSLSAGEMEQFNKMSSSRIQKEYSWNFIIDEYEEKFLQITNNDRMLVK